MDSHEIVDIYAYIMHTCTIYENEGQFTRMEKVVNT